MVSYLLLLTIFGFLHLAAAIPTLHSECDPNDDVTVYSANALNSTLHEDLDPYFIRCSKYTSRWTRHRCPVVFEAQQMFDPWLAHCVTVTGRSKRQLPSSSRVNGPCTQNTDCVDQSTMYCETGGRCACLYSYIAINDYCIRKINPGESGCSGVDQCRAVWPDTTCSGGTCTCPSGTVPYSTRDGGVCISGGKCPLPSTSGGTVDTRLRYNNAVVTCTSGNVASCTANGQNWADTYDCIYNIQGYSGTPYCCPNRAHTCTLPLVTSGSGLTRYYYNSISRSCSQFSFSSSPTAGNANNFITQTQCLAFCQDSCPRGVYQYTGTAQTSQITSCVSGSCDSTYYQCTTIKTSKFCCMDPDNICNDRGGMTQSYGSSTRLGLQATTTVSTTTRYRWDSNARTCVSFAWYGQAGDYNNFPSQSDCLSYCSSLLCTQGTPIKDSNGNNFACSSNSQCSSEYFCTNSVCCPRAQTVCTMAQRSGTCQSSASRYWYNSNTRLCEGFSYTGCGGNANNFQDEATCLTYCRNTKPKPNCIQGEAYTNPGTSEYQTCNLNSVNGFNGCPSNYDCYFDGVLYGCCPTPAYVCSQSSFDAGKVCGPEITRYFYDASGPYCSTFVYNGCGGHPNNFNTRSQCESYCGVGGCPYGGTPSQTGNQITQCNQGAACPSGYDCTSVNVGNSQTYRCCATRAAICQSGAPGGFQTGCNSGETTRRYYFNQATRACVVFDFNGCADNGNNFATVAQCQDFCASAACGLGEVVAVDPNNRQPISCNVNLANSCPTNYKCIRDVLTQRYVCCGATGSGVCTSNARAFINPLTNSPRLCMPNIQPTGGCPGSYSCVYTARTVGTLVGGYYCCGSSSGDICPSGYAPYRATAGLFNNAVGQTQVCTTGNFVNSCPQFYTCRTSNSVGNTGYCCTSSPICANGAEFEKNSVTSGSNALNDPKKCIIGISSSGCSIGYTCTAQLGLGQSTGYCCRGSSPVTSTVCGTDRAPLTGFNNQPQVCSPGTTCAAGYTCMQSPTQLGSYYCCSSPISQICAAYNQQVERLTNGGGPRICQNGGVGQCSSSTSLCRQYSLDGQFYCCGSGTTANSECGVGKTVFQINNIAQTCIPGSNCNPGFTCTRSPSNSGIYYCCSSAQTQVCTTGNPERDTVGNPRICSNIPGITQCGVGYQCTQATGSNVFYCCSGTIVSGTCPSGLSPEQLGGTTRYCSGGGDTSCTTGYSCQFSPGSNRWTCCGMQGNCPTNAVMQMATSNQRVNCFAPGQSTGCSFGFTCTTTNVGNICCTGNAVLTPQTNVMCQQGMQALVDASGNPFPCTSCPAGYSCQIATGTTQQICCPSSPNAVCQQPTSQGANCNGRTPSSRYGYNSALRTCSTFLFSGCGGNSNNFQTMQQCNAFCQTTIVPTQPPVVNYQCPVPGQQPYREQATNAYRYCSVGSFTQQGCPSGYNCQQATAIGAFGTVNLCCGTGSSVPAQTCPTGTNAYISPVSNRVLDCTLNPNACPTPYQCLYSNALRARYCCSGSGIVPTIAPTDNVCPSGTFYPYPGSQEPLACSSPADNKCPFGYSCSPSTRGGFVCCSTGILRTAGRSEPNNVVEVESGVVVLRSGIGWSR